MTVTMTGASWTVVTPLAALWTTLARSSWVSMPFSVPGPASNTIAGTSMSTGSAVSDWARAPGAAARAAAAATPAVTSRLIQGLRITASSAGS